MKFEELNLVPAILKAVQEQGYDTPTPIQAQAIPAVLEGHDLLAGAQTGTGKTGAFALPILQRLSQEPAARQGIIRALILAPTRELAAQVEESVRSYGKYLDLKSTVVFGGVGINPQIDRIASGCDILVATPGRLLDLEGQGHIDLSQVEVLVLDEADRMLDMGFIHDVKKILALMPNDKQSLLFSATFSNEIRDLAGRLLKSPKSIQVTPPNTTVELINQLIYPVGRRHKRAVLAHLIGENDWSQVLVFTRTKFGANRVADYLNERGIKAMALHGNKSQSARTQALGEFKSGELRALVATDIAARGIDIDELPHVVNYDIPNVPEDYVHRIGRTGRAGSVGEAVSLVCMDEEGFMHQIERFTRQQIPVRILEQFGPDEGEIAEPIAMGRQTLWGGLGPAPSRDVMQAAARNARQEMMQRIRESRADRGPRGRSQTSRRKPANGERTDGDNREGSAETVDARQDNHGNSQEPRNNRNRRRGRRGANRPQEASGNERSRQNGDQPASQPQPQPRRREQHDDDRLPSHIDPLQTNVSGRRKTPRAPSHDGPAGQPDPMRTSIDLMKGSGRGKRASSGGGGGNRRSSGGRRGGY